MAPRWGEHLVEQEEEVNRASILKADAYEYLAIEFASMEDKHGDGIARRSTGDEICEKRGNRTNNGVDHRIGYDSADETQGDTASDGEHDLVYSNSYEEFGARQLGNRIMAPQPTVPYCSHEEPSAGNSCGALASADAEDRDECGWYSSSEFDKSNDDDRAGYDSEVLYHKLGPTTNAGPKPGKRSKKPGGGAETNSQLEDVSDEPASRPEFRPHIISETNDTNSRKTDDKQEKLSPPICPTKNTNDNHCMATVTTTTLHGSRRVGVCARERARHNRRLQPPENELGLVRQQQEGKGEREAIAASTIAREAAAKEGEEDMIHRTVNNGTVASRTPGKGLSCLEGHRTGRTGGLYKDEKILVGVMGNSDRSLLYSPRPARKNPAAKAVLNETISKKNTVNCAEERSSPPSRGTIDPDYSITKESELIVAKRKVCHLLEEVQVLNDELKKAEMRYVAAEATAAAVLDRARVAELSRDVKEIQVRDVALR